MRLYARLAAGGIHRNGRLYLPYILTCSLMAMMFYIVCFLSDNSMLNDMRGGDMLRQMMGMGVVIMAIFAGIFLFYTNSFLIKQRKREFGLYNVLGMGKRSIARIMTWETAMVYLISMVLGASAGILLSKLAELLAVKILSGKAQYEFSVSISGIISMLSVFAVIFLLIYLNVLRQVFFSKPIELLHSESAGEKPPRANWFVAVLGAVLLGIAYYMAVTIEEPMTAILGFMFAVVLVILATYLLFIAGSVAVCKALQKNKSYYYRINHFISISQMAYRMKRNGAGLASICILCTMLLVTLSSTICLYAGEEQMLYQRYPRDMAVSLYKSTETERNTLHEAVENSLNKQGISAENVINYTYMSLGGAIIGNKLELEPVGNAFNELTLDLRSVYILPVEDYNQSRGENIVLSDGETAIFTKGHDFSFDSLEISNFGSFSITHRVSDFDLLGTDASSVLDSIYLFVKDKAVLDEINRSQKNSVGTHYYKVYYLGFDMDCPDDAQTLIYEDIYKQVNNMECAHSIELRIFNRSEFMGMYGGLFFLGIIFGGVFLLAAVLIMYYKQISEGYDDRARFDILRKVGMNDRDIRRAVNSQVLTVFFAPLIASGIHMAFAFPMLTKLLGLFGMMDTGFLAVVTLICYGVFAAVYILVYAITSSSYYRIVSSAGEKQ